MKVRVFELPTPVGPLHMAVGPDGVAALGFGDHDALMTLLERSFGPLEVERPTSPSPEARAVQAYLEGDVEAIDDVPVVQKGTPFQMKVWEELCKIPSGATLTYGELAARIGRPKASRAVGAAVGQNLVSLIVPCHRVVGASGRLTGFGWGLEYKRWLLAHEGAILA
jgi:methylated-DNA-[protein]-cysteine S-methyltransferase